MTAQPWPLPFCMNSHTTSSPGPLDPQSERIVQEEQDCLVRVVNGVQSRRDAAANAPRDVLPDYDQQLIALRDEMAAARMEDVPPLLEQMERLQSLAQQRRRDVAQGAVDLRSPYFGRLVVQESQRQREILIGHTTYLDSAAGIRIVDWRDAPVSRLYYRYQEGDDYAETFGDREVEGEVLTRRSLSIVDRELRRVTGSHGTLIRTGPSSVWKHVASASSTLHGGEGMAARAEPRVSGRLGTGEDLLRDEKTLREITALIDPLQFELITRPDSGLVVIQGGAGSGKTTLGLHRLAYLAFQDRRRFRPDRLLVVVFNDALARYIGEVLPSLGVQGVAIRTYVDWAHRLRRQHVPRLPASHSSETPSSVTRLKKHPVMLKLMNEYVDTLAETMRQSLDGILSQAGNPTLCAQGLQLWQSCQELPLAHRLTKLTSWVEGLRSSIPVDTRLALQHSAMHLEARTRDIATAWAELLTDRSRLTAALGRHAPNLFSSADLARIHDWCTSRCEQALATLEQEQPAASSFCSATSPRSSGHDDRENPADAAEAGVEDDLDWGVDGVAVEEAATLDREDDTLLLYLHQRLRGPLLRKGPVKEALRYEHLFVDEAQDYSPVELAVLIDTVSRGQSITLAGDLAQRIHLDNGFSDWQTVLAELELSHVKVEPLRISYRSTAEIIQLAHEVLGPLAPSEPGEAIRSGAPVELFCFSHAGDAAGFLAEQIRPLILSEPRAAVAVIARFPEQADIYHRILARGEIPHLRRVADQDFLFRPGVDVTDVHQVKGLEFDYVIVVDVNASSYPDTDEARHLLHIAATRAAHQLWLVSTGTPSSLIPSALLAHAK